MGILIAKVTYRFVKNQAYQIGQDDQEIIEDFLKKNKYEYLEVLGQGDFSMVVKAFSEQSQCLVAIKVVKNIQQQNQIDLQQFEKETNILSKLKNQKNILQIIEKIQDDEQGLVAIVTELCDCNLDYLNNYLQHKFIIGNLTTIFDLNQLDYGQVLALTYQLLKGLSVLQENGIIHSDIKPDKILFNKQNNQFLIGIKLIILFQISNIQFQKKLIMDYL